MIPFAIALLIMAYWEVTLFLEGTRGEGRRKSLQVVGEDERGDRVDERRSRRVTGTLIAEIA